MITNILDGLERDELVCWLAETTSKKFLLKLKQMEQSLLQIASRQSVAPGVPEGQLRVTLNKAAALRELIDALELISKLS